MLVATITVIEQAPSLGQRKGDASRILEIRNDVQEGRNLPAQLGFEDVKVDPIRLQRNADDPRPTASEGAEGAIVAGALDQDAGPGSDQVGSQQIHQLQRAVGDEDLRLVDAVIPPPHIGAVGCSRLADRTAARQPDSSSRAAPKQAASSAAGSTSGAGTPRVKAMVSMVFSMVAILDRSANTVACGARSRPLHPIVTSTTPATPVSPSWRSARDRYRARLPRSRMG